MFLYHVKFIDSVKSYQQTIAKLARSTGAKKRIQSLFLDYLGKRNRLRILFVLYYYYSKFFLDLGDFLLILILIVILNIEFVLEYLSSGKGCFPYEVETGFDSLSLLPPKMEISGTSNLFTLGSWSKGFLKKNERGLENCLSCSK